MSHFSALSWGNLDILVLKNITSCVAPHLVQPMWYDNERVYSYAGSQQAHPIHQQSRYSSVKASSYSKKKVCSNFVSLVSNSSSTWTITFSDTKSGRAACLCWSCCDDAPRPGDRNAGRRIGNNAPPKPEAHMSSAVQMRSADKVDGSDVDEVTARPRGTLHKPKASAPPTASRRSNKDGATEAEEALERQCFWGCILVVILSSFIIVPSSLTFVVTMINPVYQCLLFMYFPWMNRSVFSKDCFSAVLVN